MSVRHSDALGVLIQADIDGELDAVQAADLALHVAACAECRQLSENLRALKTELRKEAPRYQAPPALRAAVLRQVSGKPRVPRPARRLRWRWPAFFSRMGWPSVGAFVAGAAIAALLAVIVLPVAPAEDARVAAQVATATERSLQPDHLLDIRTTSAAELTRWFRDRMHFAPPIRQPAGFRLAGGRLDYLHRRPVAVLAYDNQGRHQGGHQGRTIALYTWPEAHVPTLPKSLRSAGFTLTYWRAGGIEYWAISRSAGALAAFVQAWHRTA